jgi:spore germination cell wall hydrolase CwlJ-like protein
MIDPSVEAIAPEDTARVVALTAVGEASNQGYNGMQGVINTVVNRARHPGWWGDTLRDVCLAKEQYDCWMAGPDRERMLAIPADDAVYQQALTLAKLAVSDVLPDITGGADSYYAVTIPAPAWASAEGTTFTVQIHQHRFYITRPHAAPAPEPQAASAPPAAPTVIEAPIPIPIPPQE